jgi:hypothetical protein
MMAKKSARGRKQDRTRVAGGQDYEVRYEAKKTGTSKAEVKRAAKRQVRLGKGWNANYAGDGRPRRTQSGNPLVRVTPATTFPYLAPALEGLADPIEKSTSITVA